VSKFAREQVPQLNRIKQDLGHLQLTFARLTNEAVVEGFDPQVEFGVFLLKKQLASVQREEADLNDSDEDASEHKEPEHAPQQGGACVGLDGLVCGDGAAASPARSVDTASSSAAPPSSIKGKDLLKTFQAESPTAKLALEGLFGVYAEKDQEAARATAQQASVENTDKPSTPAPRCKSNEDEPEAEPTGGDGAGGGESGGAGGDVASATTGLSPHA